MKKQKKYLKKIKMINYKKAKKELSERVGEDFNYFPLLGDRDPPLDYRN